MRYALASLVTLIVVGMASGVPDDPTAPAARLPKAPGPAECSTAPANDRLFDGAPVPAVIPRASGGALPPPQRSAAPSKASMAEAAAVLRDLVACMNTGDVHRVLALYTAGARADAYAALASGAALASAGDSSHRLVLPGPDAGQVALVWVGEPWLTADGRMAVPVITRHGALFDAWSLVLLEREADRRRIDAIMAVEAAGGSPTIAASLPGR